MGENQGLARWLGASSAMHALFFLLLLVDLPRRKIEEPQESMTVELVTPAELAQLANAPAPSPVAAPPAPDNAPTPTTRPPNPEPPRPNQPEAPPPPPPPPPPAPPAPATPQPTAPAPTPPPSPPRSAPTPPAQAQAPSTPPPPAPPTPRAPQPEPVPTEQAALPTPPPPPPPPSPPREPAQQPPTPARPAPTPQQQAAQSTPQAEPGLPAPPPPPPAPPSPQQQAGTGQTPPSRNTAERSTSVLNTLERLRAAQQQTEAPRARPNAAASSSASGGGAPTGTAPLTQGEIRGLGDKISECWNVDAGMLGLNQITVELRIEVDPTGNVRNVRPASGSPPSDPRARSVYESARRAMLSPQCNPLQVPRDKIPTLNQAIFRFSPQGLIR